MDIVVITPEITTSGETAIVNGLFAAGLQRLHLRKTGWTETEQRHYLQAIAAEHRYRISVHQHFGQVAEMGLGGIHLNSHVQKDSTMVATLFKAKVEIKISASFHTWQEVLHNTLPYDYVFISPLYNSISKPGYEAGIDATQISNVKLQIKSSIRIFALGGVEAKHLCELRDWGFDCAAMLGGIWSAENPIEAFIEVATIANSL